MTEGFGGLSSGHRRTRYGILIGFIEFEAYVAPPAEAVRPNISISEPKDGVYQGAFGAHPGSTKYKQIKVQVAAKRIAACRASRSLALRPGRNLFQI